MRMFPHFIPEPTNAAFSYRVTAENKKKYRQEAKLAAYFQMVNYLLGTYATDDVICEAEAETVHFRRPIGIAAVRCS